MNDLLGSGHSIYFREFALSQWCPVASVPTVYIVCRHKHAGEEVAGCARVEHDLISPGDEIRGESPGNYPTFPAGKGANIHSGSFLVEDTMPSLCKCVVVTAGDVPGTRFNVVSFTGFNGGSSTCTLTALAF